jgi:hypothetical protein
MAGGIGCDLRFDRRNAALRDPDIDGTING